LAFEEFTMPNDSIECRHVVIAGAGPTGLALACDLCSRGVDVQVIDKAAGPATTSRALGLQARGREILDRLGALGDLPERAVQAHASNIYVGKRLITRFLVETQFGHVQLGPLLISQAEIEAQLRRRLAELGGTLMWDHELISATQDSHAVDLNMRTPSPLFMNSKAEVRKAVGGEGFTAAFQ
jgi:4,5-epoxidase